jgi:neutral ceramidase
VLQRGKRKVALVSVDLFMAAGGIVKQAAERAGFRESDVLVSASHTHAGPGGFANFKSYNTAAPSIETITDPISYYRLLDPLPADMQLYTFLVRQISTAIRRADRNRRPAAAAWGAAEIHGLTDNRSIEAHLADHGIIVPPGRGSVSMDPLGPDHTIDPAVNVLRVDKLIRRGHRRGRRRIPIGAWTTFADHGTVNRSEFQVYNEDHHGAAMRVFESQVRKAGRVTRQQLVANVYGNSDEGDISAGLHRSGPAAADYVGRTEAAAMFRAWRLAGKRLTRRPRLDVRWTRVCLCGQAVDGGHIASSPEVGSPFLTGSEEGRGPLYDQTHTSFEGRRSPVVTNEEQGHKLGIPVGDVPHAVPLTALRVGSRMIVSVPGEATAETGRRIRAAVQAAVVGHGITRAVISGLANEYLQYVTTPEEYDQQHYEGGSTIYGRLSEPFFRQQLSGLARRLVLGQAAPTPYAYDSTNGLRPTGAPYGKGSASGRILQHPGVAYRRLQRAHIAWQGGRLGLDRPVDHSFVRVQRRVRRRWREVTSDLGLQIVWRVDDDGRYDALWEIPLTARRGTYRLVVTAKRYTLRSRPFRVNPTFALSIRRATAPAGRVAVTLAYPSPVVNRDLTFRPSNAQGGAVLFSVGDRMVLVRRRRSTVFSVAAPPGTPVSVAGGHARDRYRNVAGSGLRLQG